MVDLTYLRFSNKLNPTRKCTIVLTIDSHPFGLQGQSYQIPYPHPRALLDEQSGMNSQCGKCRLIPLDLSQKIAPIHILENLSVQQACIKKYALETIPFLFSKMTTLPTLEQTLSL
jgi:hypothetical protein